MRSICVQGRHPGPSDAVLDRVEQFHLDSIACGVSALAAGANAPTVLRQEALEYVHVGTGGSPVPGISSNDGSCALRLPACRCLAAR